MKAKLSGEDVYQILKKKLASLELNPGQWLPENKIALELKTSRTPIRYAFSKLESDGLVQIIPRKGVFIKFFSINDIVEIFQVREALEGLASRLAAGNADLEILKGFEQFYLDCTNTDSPETAKKIYDFGEQFHDFIIKSAGNKRIEKTLEEYRIQLEICREFSFDQKFRIQPSRSMQIIKEHLDIIKAIKERNGELAETRMKEHIFNAACYTFSNPYFKQSMEKVKTGDELKVEITKPI